MKSQFRVAIIGRTGHGNYGHQIDQVWLEIPNAQLVAVADDDPNGLAQAAKRLKVDKTFTDYRTMLDEVKPDVVGICPRWIDKRYEMMMACADRNIHMFSDKPFCRTLVEADSIMAVCERTHTHLALAYQGRFSPKLDAAKKLIAEGKIGRVLEYRMRGKEDRRGGCEDFWVLGSHMLGLVRYLAGHPQWCFAAITQDGRLIEKRDVYEGNEGLGPLAGNTISVMYGMNDGSTAYFGSHKDAGLNHSRWGLRIFGSEGMLDITPGYMGNVRILADPTWIPENATDGWINVSSQGINQPEPITASGDLAGNVAIVTDLLNAIAEHRAPKCDRTEVVGVMEMLFAAFESHRQRRPVSFPLANRKHPLTMLSESS
jgi:predicted dehydrogenase